MIRLRWLPAAAVTALLVLAPPALAANWTAPAPWSTPGTALGPTVSVSVTPSGDALAVFNQDGVPRARWQYADGTFSAVFDPLAGSGLDGTGTIVGARAWGNRHAAILYHGSTDRSTLANEQATAGLWLRRFTDTAPPEDPIPVASSSATRSVGVSASLFVTGAGDAVVGWFDAARPATDGTTDVRYSRLRILYASGGPPGPVQGVDQQRDRTTTNGIGTSTAAGTEQPLLWLNDGGTGVLATRRLIDPDDATTPAPRMYRLQPFNLADGVSGSNAGTDFTFPAPIPDPFTVGSFALSIGPTGGGALFYSLTANAPPSGQFGTGLATWSLDNPLGPGLTAPLDAPNGSQNVAAARDGAGRTVVAWSARFTSSPHPSLTVLRLDTGFAVMSQAEEFPAPQGLAALVGTATGARLITRDLVNGTDWLLQDREVPTAGPSGQPRQILPAEKDLAVAAQPVRAADGTILLPLRRRADGKDSLWVMRLPESAGPPGITGDGGDGSPAPPPKAPSPPATPSATQGLGLLRTTGGVVRIPAKGSALVRLRCTASTACTVRLRAKNGKTTLAALNGTIPAGKSAALKLTLSKAGRALVRRKGRRATLRLTGTIAAGGRSSAARLTLTIRRG